MEERTDGRKFGCVESGPGSDEKNGRIRHPQNQAAGVNGDVNGGPVAWARRSPKETAALINPHVERGVGRKKRNTHP